MGIGMMVELTHLGDNEILLYIIYSKTLNNRKIIYQRRCYWHSNIIISSSLASRDPIAVDILIARIVIGIGKPIENIWLLLQSFVANKRAIFKPQRAQITQSSYKRYFVKLDAA